MKKTKTVFFLVDKEIQAFLSDFFNLEDETDMVSRNVGKELQLFAA